MRTGLPQVPGHHRTEFEHPAADRLFADNEATLRQEVLNIAVAQSEPEIKPDGMADDVRRKSVPSIANGLHGPPLPHAPAPSLVNVAMPYVAMQQALGLSHEDLAQLARNSFEAAFLMVEEKQALLRRVDNYVAAQAFA